MKHTRVVLLALVSLASAAAVLVYRRADAKEPTSYRLASATRGDVQATVSATGTLGAVTTVQVGTQVSGQVSAIYADFNQRVKKGELLARIDPTLAQQAVRESEAGIERAKALLAQAEQEYQRNKQLVDARVLSPAEFDVTTSGYAVAKANVTSAQIALDRARQNLAYTSIYAPIDGVVVERNIDVGQTVAASLSAPQLFLIANNLTRMQILASVDESDIGRITERLPVQFTVQSFANQTFAGIVKQVRLQSTTVNNIVSYTAVIDVTNPEGTLLPGMTATVQFLTGSATDAVLVPNAALRFRATPAMVALLGERTTAPVRTGDSSATRTVPVGSARSAGAGSSATTASESGTIWHIDGAGKPAMARVSIGLTNGQFTVVQSPVITEGTQLIVGVMSDAQASAPDASANPLAPQSAPRGRGGF